MTNLIQTLQDRGQKYGDFADHARITQALKDVMTKAMDARGFSNFNAMHREALSMIAHKIGRIINGDPNLADSWHDIAGNAKLVEDRIPTAPPQP
jgi:hypothetical protein